MLHDELTGKIISSFFKDYNTLGFEIFEGSPNDAKLLEKFIENAAM